MAKVELKKPIVEEIGECIKGAQSVVLVDYRGLTVEQDTELRKQLREAGIVYKVPSGRAKRYCCFKDRCNSSSKNIGEICQRCSSFGAEGRYCGRRLLR